MQKGALSIIAVLLLLAGGAWYLAHYVSQTPLTNEEDMAVRAMLTEFGTKLRFVSLLAPSDVRRAAMEEYYGPYLTSDLLAAWSPEDAEALGRYTSSPSPERIDIIEVRKTSPDTYIVDANVIETVMTSASSSPEVAGVYPVTFKVRREGGTYRIAAATKGAYSEIPHRQTLTGAWECLPHVAGQSQTEECAYGIALQNSDAHYAVNTSLMESVINIPAGKKVRISGIVTPANQLNSDQWQKYDIDGIISATEIEVVK